MHVGPHSFLELFSATVASLTQDHPKSFSNAPVYADGLLQLQVPIVILMCRISQEWDHVRSLLRRIVKKREVCPLFSIAFSFM